MAEDREDRYRKLYLELVDELDAKEKEWELVGQRLRRIVTHLVIVAEGPSNPEVSAELTGLRDALREGLDLEAVEARVETLKNRVLGETPWAEPGEGYPPIHQVLVPLVERLPLPPDLAPDALALIESFETGVAPDALPDAIDGISALVLEVSRKLQTEKLELEALLREVTDRLRDIDQGLDSTLEGAHEVGRAAARSFDETVEAEIKGLAEVSDHAPDLDSLKSSVRRTLDIVREHIVARRTEEARRESCLHEEVDHLRSTVQSLEREVDEHRERTRAAREASLRDALTGCFNRLAYQERVAVEEARYKRYGSPLSVIVIDIDHFKVINDTYGHRAGDKVLQMIAKLAASHVREVDFFARYGGEEFVVLLPETDRAGARTVAEKVRSAVEEFKFHSRGKRIPITISAGVAELAGGDTVAAAFERADKALYGAKEGGRNRIGVSG